MKKIQASILFLATALIVSAAGFNDSTPLKTFVREFPLAARPVIDAEINGALGELGLPPIDFTFVTGGSVAVGRKIDSLNHVTNTVSYAQLQRQFKRGETRVSDNFNIQFSETDTKRLGRALADSAKKAGVDLPFAVSNVVRVEWRVSTNIAMHFTVKNPAVNP